MAHRTLLSQTLSHVSTLADTGMTLDKSTVARASTPHSSVVFGMKLRPLSALATAVRAR